jgi:hypothetical protein
VPSSRVRGLRLSVMGLTPKGCFFSVKSRCCFGLTPSLLRPKVTLLPPMETIKVTDPEGYEISLEDERWQHITQGHPEMAELQDAILDTLKDPELIYQDAERPETFYYYRLAGRTLLRTNDIYIVTVVRRSDGNKVARVMTSHLVRKIKEGRKLRWFRRRTS